MEAVIAKAYEAKSGGKQKQKFGDNLKKLDMSEQYLLDCAYKQWPKETSPRGVIPETDGEACKGAWLNTYPEWLAYDGGLAPHENDYAYLDNQPVLHCRQGSPGSKAAKWNPGFKIVNAVNDYSCHDDNEGNLDDAKMQRLIMETGGVVTGVAADDIKIEDYKNGVIRVCTKDEVNHAVVAVGWGQTEDKDGNSLPYWIVRNSWGSGWGEDGYFRVKRGGVCEVGKACITAQAQATGSEDPAPDVKDQEETENKFVCNMTALYNRKSRRFQKRINRKIKKEKEFIFQYRRPKPVHRAKVKCKWDENQQLLCRAYPPGPTNVCKYICRNDTC